MTACLSAAVALCAQSAGADEARMAVKRLHAPPSDILSGTVCLPEPSRTPTLSQASLLRGAFAPAEDGRGSVVRFRFEHGGGFLRLLALGRDSVRWSGMLRSGGHAISLADAGHPLGPVTEIVGSQSLIGIDEPARGAELELAPGVVEIEFRASVPTGTPAVLVIDDASAEALAVHLASRVQRAGDPLALVVEGRTQREFRAPSIDPRDGAQRPCSVRRATIRWSDGTVESGSLIESGPRAASPSVLVRFPAARVGDATVWIEGEVVDAAGVPRPRTVLYATRIVDGARLAGAPTVEAGRGGQAVLSVPLSTTDAGTVLFAATELWAVTHGSARPLCWIGGLTEVSTDAARIEFDPHAIDLHANEWLECRNLRLHERDGFAPLDHAVRLGAMLSPGVLEERASPARVPSWCGVPGIASVPVPESSWFVPPVGSHALVLAHGYCADANTWPLAQFGTDAWRYEALNQNMSNDAFAVDLATRAAQFKSYGVVAHSQGGCAALHLYTHYWSGLDWAGAGRLIQTVGTPFEGTALAGNIAALGEIFGVQCGSNYDMTYDGAAAWLSTIPTAARSRVYTHTTTFTNHPFQYDYCNILSDVLLSDPEDGVVEDWSGHIPGAVSLGLKTGWCHVSGMRDPDQTLDSQRNATMNAQGAR